jgi:hypothetical protein
VLSTAIAARVMPRRAGTLRAVGSLSFRKEILVKRGWLMALGLMGLTCGALAVPACGDDTTDNAGPDSGTHDATARDSALADTTSPQDANAVDSNQPETGSDDGGLPEGQAEASNDGSADASDGGACALFDGSLDDAAVAAGQALILSTYHCYGCHQPKPFDGGLTLSGNDKSLLGDAGAVFAPNLTPDPQTGLGCWTDQQIETAILTAVDDQGAALCVMPKWGQNGMTAAEAVQITQFLRSLPAAAHQVPDSVCPAVPDGGVDAGDAGGPDGATSDAGDAGDAGGDAGDAGDAGGDAGSD